MRVASLVFVTCLLIPDAATAQSCYAENDGPTFEDGSSTGNAAFGVKFSPDISLNAGRAEVFTGEVTDQHTVAVWSHDPVGDLPVAPLASATRSIQRSSLMRGSFAMKL